MNRRDPHPNRSPLPRPIPAAVVGILVGALALLWALAFAMVQRAVREHLHAVAFQGTVALQGLLRGAGPPGPDHLRKAFQEFEFQGVLAAALFRGDGRLVAASEDGVFEESAAEMAREAMEGHAVVSREAISRGGVRALRVAMPRPPPPGRPGAGRGGPPGWMEGPGEDRRAGVVMVVDVDQALGAPLRRWLWAQGIASLAIAMALEATRRRARRAVEAFEALQEESRRREVLARLGEMSAVLAHEVRNPLAALKGHLQLLQEDLAGDDRRRGRLEVVLQVTGRLETLVRDLLESTSDRPADRREVPLSEVIAASLDLAGEAPGPSLEVRAVGTGTARIDAQRVPRMIGNLVRNAREAAGPGGHVRLTVRREARILVFLVEDSGPGLAEAEADRVFQPFVTGKARGTGLGLFIARRVAEAHGGTLVAGRSDDLGGARFEARIPEE
ncbi:HAMP domain-containing histidine kinase [Myxococcota bacterium]|nr:HAMP domain-containing histidine kinase [Myxococcota bacterium]